MSSPYQFTWANLAFGSKKPLRELKATFIAAPRELSEARLKQLIKTFLPVGHIVLGISQSRYVSGFEGQPQFRTLEQSRIESLVAKVNAASPKKIYTLTYASQDEPHIIAKDLFARYVFINGSWQYSFHLRPTFFALAKLQADYKLLSPFASEAEAKAYLHTTWPLVENAQPLPPPRALMSSAAALTRAAVAGRRSFDHTFQTGAVLAEARGSGQYAYIAAAWNGVVPYQTYAMHNGSSREQNFSPPGDLTFYDTNHAEVALVLQAQKHGLRLTGNTLFINLLPCPSCARLLSATDIAEVVYALDHSAGYAHALLAETGKLVTKL